MLTRSPPGVLYNYSCGPKVCEYFWATNPICTFTYFWAARVPILNRGPLGRFHPALLPPDPTPYVMQ